MAITEMLLRFRPEHRSGSEVSFPVDQAVLSGAYIDWPSQYDYRYADLWVRDLKEGFATYLPVNTVRLRAAEGATDPKPVTFNLIVGGKEFRVAIDYCDYMDRLYEEELRNSLAYFKMQYRRTGYQADTPYYEKIVPGGYVNGGAHFYRYINHIRSVADSGVFAADVYGRFSTEFARHTRETAHLLLREQKHFTYRGGLILNRYFKFLNDCAEARICLDLPGNGDFCFRLVDYLAIGCCVISARHQTRFPVELENAKNIVYIPRDLSGLVETCRYYLKHDTKREAIRSEARSYFDRYLHREQLTSYYLLECVKRLPGAA
jgi:hypothetical protein